MFYFDTSFIVPLFINEPTSEEVAAKLQAIPPTEIALSLWTKTEFSSVLARKVRMQESTEEFAFETINKFEQMMANSCQVIIPEAADFDLSAQYVQNFQTGLRAGDALHLAIAKNHGAILIYTLDVKLAKAASLLNIPCIDIEQQ
jgi:predicted nucleic acid-binding protein